MKINSYLRVIGKGFLLPLTIIFSCFFPVSAGNHESVFLPPKGKILLIVGQDVQNISAYMEKVRIIPGGLSVYTSAEFAEGLDSADDNGGGIQHAQMLIDQYPNTAILMAIYMVDMEEKVYSGDVDQSLDRIGNWIKSVKRPVYLRIGYEFDYPDNGYEPEKYTRAYRYIVDRFRRMGISNVAYVWHSYADKVTRPHSDWYPGDDYVDWFAITYFVQPHEEMNSFAQMAEKHGKPLMIAEASPWFLSTSKSDQAWEKWFVPFFNFIRENKVKAVAYINCDWDKIPLFESKGWGDTRVQSNDKIKANWISEISKDRYLKSSFDLYRQLEFQK
ncbi:MAG: Beta-1,3-xylanase XYL4 [Elusimicrobia bacterium]|nr:Beta-1,3-xylanase XYL4 [Elusimicrobiota bacterium]